MFNRGRPFLRRRTNRETLCRWHDHSSRLLATPLNSPFQAERLFSRCFTEEQLAYLRAQPEFEEATQKIDSLKAAVEVFEMGDKLLRKANRNQTSSSG